MMRRSRSDLADTLLALRSEIQSRKADAFPSLSLSESEAAARQKFGDWMRSSAWTGHVSPSTREAYRDVAAAHLLADSGEVNRRWSDGLTNIRTYQFRKAAVLWTLRMGLLSWSDAAAFARAVPEGVEGIPVPSGMRQVYKHWQALEDAQAVKWSAVRPRETTKRPSKKGLDRIPENAFEKIFLRCSPKWRPYACILEFSGCRPSEIENGVWIQTVAGGGLKFIIRGSKTDPVPKEGRAETMPRPKGQGVRSIVVFPDRKCFRAQFFRGMVERNAEQVGNAKVWKVEKQKARDVTRYFHDLPKQIWKNRDAAHRPSAYSYRHSFARMLKSSVSREEVAVALGHASTKTQGVYGAHGSRKKSAVSFSNITGQRKENLRRYEVKKPDLTKDRTQKRENVRADRDRNLDLPSIPRR